VAEGWVFSFQFSVFSFQFSVFSFQFSVFSFQFLGGVFFGFGGGGRFLEASGDCGAEGADTRQRCPAVANDQVPANDFRLDVRDVWSG
jgi:hypothetical protein